MFFDLTLNRPESPLLDFHGWYLGQTPIRPSTLTEEEVRAKLPELEEALTKTMAENKGKVSYLEIKEGSVRAQPQAWVTEMPKIATITKEELADFLTKWSTAGDYTAREALSQDFFGYNVKFTRDPYSALIHYLFFQLSALVDPDPQWDTIRMRSAYKLIPLWVQEAIGPLPEGVAQ